MPKPPAQCQICRAKLPPPKRTRNGRPLGRPRVRCNDCAGTKVRTRPPAPAPDAPFGPTRIAAEATIHALETAGALEAVDASRIAALRATASAVDADPMSAALHREHRMAEASLRLTGAAASEVDAYANLMHKLGGDQA